MTPFSRLDFTRYYDLLYSDKNYPAECDLVEDVFKSFASQRPATILDAGCGSGGHAIHLAQRGYDIVGLDRSPSLLQIARKRSDEAGLRTQFHEGDLRTFELGRQFDACISMFAVMGFQLKNSDVQQALRQIRKHLTPGAIFLFDVWHGSAVLLHGVEKRLKLLEKDGLRLYRFATPTLDPMSHTNEVNQHLLVIDIENNKMLDEVVEPQLIRYFFPQEVIFHLEIAGFEVCKLFTFGKLDQDASAQDWEIGIVARACA